MSRGHERNASYYETLITKYGPIFKLSRDFRPYIYIGGHERAIMFLRENDDALVGAAQPISATIPNGFLRYMPASIHSGYRRILQSGFTTDSINEALPFIAATIRNALEKISTDCRETSGGKVDFDGYLRDSIFSIVLQAFFGVRRDTPLFDRMCALHADIDTRTDNCGAEAKRHGAMSEMMSVLRKQFDTYPKEPVASPPCFLKAMAERNEAASIDATVLGNWVAMVEFATIDVVGLLRWLLKMLIDHPAWVNRVRGGPNTGPEHSEPAGTSVVERIVKETLRLERSEFLTRKATRDIWFEGYRIPKGWTIRIGIREGNRNPDIFDRPADFDPDRFLDREYTLTEFAPFGLYRHNCIGAEFATAIARIFVTELATGFDLEAGGDWTTEYAPPHWRPCTGYRIGLKVRAS